MRLAVYTLGCKVNQYDSQLMKESLADAGHTVVRWGEDADIYIVNTCTVTARSDRKSRKAIFEAHRRNGFASIFVTGCCAKRQKSLLEVLPGVTAVGERDVILKRLGSEPLEKIRRFSDRARPFVKVQDGCDRFCSYCIVPHVRGRSRSRPPREVLEEVSGLVAAGYREIVLTGICLGDYTHEKTGLVELLARLLAVKGLGRLRLSSIEPDSISEELIDLIAGSSKLCRHLHIPFQSGDEGVLSEMRRPYTISFYHDLIGRIRHRMPDCGISIDLIVAFPGESPAAFRGTIDLVRMVRPVRVHRFPYSSREGTPAAAMNDQLPAAEVKRRLALLGAVAVEQSFQFRSSLLGSEQTVLMERNGGYTSNYVRVILNGECSQEGELVPVRMTEVTHDTTHAIPVSSA